MKKCVIWLMDEIMYGGSLRWEQADEDVLVGNKKR
jgi:hypothetical protein